MNLFIKFHQDLRKIVNNFISIFSKKNKWNIVIDSIALVSYFLAILSIPLCSFRIGLNKITWVLTILFLLFMMLSIILFSKVQINKLSFSILLFIIWITICAMININLHNGIGFTPILLLLSTFIIYLFVSQNKQYRKLFMILILLAISIFMICYTYSYFDDLISLNFKRLGENFGDINDIAICFGIGFSLYFFLIFNSNFNVLKFIFEIMFLLMFGLCGLSTGSKIFILVIVVTSLFSIIKFMVRLHIKWYVCILIILSLIVVFVLILNLPAFGTIKNRVLEFLNPKEKDESTYLRFQMFIDGFYMFLRRPLFGFGISGYFTSSSIGGCWSHNNFSELLCSYGLIGFILFYIPYILVFKNKKQIFTSNQNNLFLVLSIAFICCMFSVALESQKIFAYSIPVFYSLYDQNNVVVFDIKRFKELKEKEI